VDWGEWKLPDCNGKIGSVKASVKGHVTREDGSMFDNSAIGSVDELSTSALVSSRDGGFSCGVVIARRPEAFVTVGGAARRASSIRRCFAESSNCPSATPSVTTRSGASGHHSGAMGMRCAARPATSRKHEPCRASQRPNAHRMRTQGCAYAHTHARTHARTHTLRARARAKRG
jgi:hypothetical protein